MPIFRCVFIHHLLTDYLGVYLTLFPSHLQVTSHPSPRSSVSRTWHPRQCVTALPPLMAVCWTHLPRHPPPWHHRQPRRPLTRSRLNPCPSPPNRRAEPTTPTSPCQGKPRAPATRPRPPPLPPIQASPSTASRRPFWTAPSPSPPCLPPCSPHPRLSTRQPYIPIMPWCRHNLSLWSPNQWSEWEKNVKLFTLVYCFVFLNIFIDIRPSF